MCHSLYLSPPDKLTGKGFPMKTSNIIILSLAVAASTAYAQRLPVLATTMDVAAGRNLRSQGTRFCSITVNSEHSRGSSSATAVILLPKNARLLDARVISPSKTSAKCGRTKVIGDNNVVSCKLSRLSFNKKVILRARYRQQIPSGNGCTAYIQASNGF